MSNVERPDIDAIKALADSATAGDWSVCESEPGRSGHRMVEVHSSDYLDSICQVGEDWARNVHDDAAFIAAARTAVPQMAAYIEALEAALREVADRSARIGAATTLSAAQYQAGHIHALVERLRERDAAGDAR